MLYKVLAVYKKSETYDCLLQLKLIKKLIFLYKRAGFFLKQIAIVSQKYDVMLIFIYCIKVDENNALARTFIIRVLSESLTKNLD